jgi:hypothetical protein
LRHTGAFGRKAGNLPGLHSGDLVLVRSNHSINLTAQSCALSSLRCCATPAAGYFQRYVFPPLHWSLFMRCSIFLSSLLSVLVLSACAGTPIVQPPVPDSAKQNGVSVGRAVVLDTTDHMTVHLDAGKEIVYSQLCWRWLALWSARSTRKHCGNRSKDKR